MGTNEQVISVENISKCYNVYARPQDRLKQMMFSLLPTDQLKTYSEQFWALKDISFSVNKSETVGIIGRNGSGKSTLLQLIAGTLQPTSGNISVNGRVVALLELGSGFNPEFSGEENIYLSGSILGITKQEMDERMQAIIDFADIGEFIKRPVKTYSSGMHARLAFSVAINTDPEILIVDEILAVGDAAFQAKCNKAFHNIREKGCTVLLVSQDPYMVRTFCTSALYLRKGQIVAYGNPTEVTEKYLMEIEKAQLDDEKKIEEKVLLTEKESEISEAKDLSLQQGPLYRIEEVKMLDSNDKVITTVKSGQDIRLRFNYKKLTNNDDKVVFVFSLYRHDGLYICGNTTLMDKLNPFPTQETGIVEVYFPKIRLLSGNYKWRVAIDDDRGLGIYVEAYTEIFNVIDDLEAVGLVNLEREWVIKTN
ncbi:ABC transporter ATP-binding protein [Paenibacillus ehimensis]|uniref:ABC transporter ATP-binding protein n=1 Tax=Paenibacillus ehimensis TaxID=79264 RepID=UPI002DB68D31|nr:ABC transporter ATP-binding protein [Paenibacillus ehimensis]MEC0213252.1 ABC transporter ATP-binding protein [Paenibacillus ehimensis]